MVVHKEMLIIRLLTDPDRRLYRGAVDVDKHLVRKIEFRTREAIDEFISTPIYLSPNVTLKAFDGRIIHANGNTTELDKTILKAQIAEAPHRSAYRMELTMHDLNLSVGDQLEYIISQGYGAWRVNMEIDADAGPYPIREKHIVVEYSNELLQGRSGRDNIEVITFNQWPERVSSFNDATSIHSWQFNDLAPTAAEKYLIARIQTPYLKIRSSKPLDPSALTAYFDQCYEYTSYTGRKHIHAFVDHVAARRKALKGATPVEIVRDIVAFVHDSITIVDETAMPPATPIGAHFHSRRLSREKVVVLYRQMMSLLELPLYACSARDRYEAGPGDTVRVEDMVTHLLAFKDPDSGGMHFITPNTVSERYLLDEIPYWLLGQQAFIAILRNGDQKHGVPELITLPIQKPTDNLLSEKIQLSFSSDPPGAVGEGRAMLTGQFRCTASRVEGDESRPNMTFPALRYPGVENIQNDASTLRTTYTFNCTLPGHALKEQTDGWLIDLSQLISLPTFASLKDTPVHSLLPYPNVIRLDIYVTFPENIEITSSKDVHLENSVGSLKVLSTIPTGSRTLHWHLEHVLNQIWLDSTAHRDYTELITAASAPEQFMISLRTK